MPTNPLLPIGVELLRLRLERGLSLRRAASLASVDYSRLREWERGVDNHTGRAVIPPFEALKRLARAYGVQPDTLFAIAGYTPVGALSPFEQDLIEKVRLLEESERNALANYLENLIRQRLPSV